MKPKKILPLGIALLCLMDFFNKICFTPEWVSAIAAVVGVLGLLITIGIQIRTVRIQAQTSSLQAKQIFRDEELQRLKYLPYFSVIDTTVDGKNVIVMTLMDNSIRTVLFQPANNLPIRLYLSIDFGFDEKPGKEFTYTYEWLDKSALDFRTYKVFQLEY